VIFTAKATFFCECMSFNPFWVKIMAAEQKKNLIALITRLINLIAILTHTLFLLFVM